MFSLLTAYRCILQPPSIRGYNSRRMYIKGVDQAHDLSKVLPEWHMMKLFMGGLGALVSLSIPEYINCFLLRLLDTR
ncbi:hypothetical protein TWF569_005592 [Orbilia oligospora]|nr:hypothetical protein TWF569_005592 [Orbilia oligospora]